MLRLRATRRQGNTRDPPGSGFGDPFPDQIPLRLVGPRVPLRRIAKQFQERGVPEEPPPPPNNTNADCHEKPQ